MRNIFKLILIISILITTFTACYNDVGLLKKNKNKSEGFIHVENGVVVDGYGEKILLKGMALGNDVWSNPTKPVFTDHNEDSYKDLQDMGFNCVRFYLNFQIFEDDEAPYVYKQSGFDWIDMNIEWAKKYNIKIILNMHVPQGGYQSQGNGAKMWTIEENQHRLAALWKEIARRYAGEETIAGYGLLNEPIVPELDTVKNSINQCRDLMQYITDAIREVDKNHIIFAERVCALLNMETGVSNWSLNVSDTQFLLNDSNTVYEFHSYEPYSFTHQDMDWAKTKGITKKYPSNEIALSNMLNGWVGCIAAKSTESLDDGWNLYQSEPARLTDKYNIGIIALRAANTGDGGTVLFDDVVLEEYKGGKLVNTLQNLSFDNDAGEFNFWASDGEGKTYFSPSNGYGGGGCLAISNTTSDANVSGYRFALEEGSEYIIRAKVKMVDTRCEAMPRIDFSLAEKVMKFNAEYLEENMKTVLKFGIDNNVPMYLGEFGAATTAFTNERGGEQWTADMLEICKKYNVHFTYHAYHENAFGLYMNSARSSPAQRNDKLAEVFYKMLK